MKNFIEMYRKGFTENKYQLAIFLMGCVLISLGAKYYYGVLTAPEDKALRIG